MGDETEISAPQFSSCYRMESGQDLIQIKQYKPQPYQRPVDTWCLEASWEVANKQGGIYTVLRSKAAVSIQELGDKYIMLGPLTPEHVNEVEICSSLPLPGSPLANSLQVCRDKGWNVTVGRWLVAGNPTVLLFDISSAAGNMNAWKQELYEKAQIGIPHSDRECNDLIILGFMMAQFIADFKWQVSQSQEKVTKVLAHFHEWMSGVSLIMLRLWKVDVATVFTTHATLLGRHLCAGAMDFYNYLQHFNVDVEAGKRKIYHRYCLERAAAHLTHIFTTVSDITAQEAEHLIKRKPDVITPNGLNVKRMCHEFQNLHHFYKQKIINFVHGHFHGHINFDLDKTLFFFIAGRYEFSNKGGDVFIESLARLNHYLKSSGSDVTVISFIIFPTKNSSFNKESLKGHAITKSLRETIQEIKTKIGRNLYENCCKGDIPRGENLISADDKVKLKRVVLASSQRNSWPPITTHCVEEEDKDPVIQALKRCNLLNDPEDRVKVVFHPEFLGNDNPLLGLSYEEFVRGCHLGVFPSYYEPWGYTPAECTVMGIPSVTTNLSGFGSFIEEHVVQPQCYGIYVVDRKFQSVEESVKDLAKIMFDFSQLTRRQRVIMRNRTERLSDLLDWRRLGVNYSQARYYALHRAFPADFPNGDIESLQYSCQYVRPTSSFSSNRREEEEEDIDQDEEENEEQ